MFWTVQLNMNDFESNDWCEYKLKQNQRSLKLALIKSASTTLCLICFVPLSLSFYQLSSIFSLIVKYTKVSQMLFTFLWEKRYFMVFSRQMSWMKQLAKWAGGYKLQAAKNGGNLARNSHTFMATDWVYHFSHTS